MTKAQRMAELRKAIQLFLRTLENEDDMMAVASAYPLYAVGKAYVANDVFSYGFNSVGDTQLYKVLQAHTSQSEWEPSATPSLYKAIGITDGVPEWVQPIGAVDAYNTGDIVRYNGIKYRSTIDGNVWAPDIYGWEAVA